MRHTAVAMLAMVILPLACVPSPGTTDEGDPAGTDSAAIIRGNTRFALDLYERLKDDGNLFFSPYSVSTALAMTYAGARGETEREMAEVLGFPIPDPGAEVGAETASAIRERVAATFASLEDGLSADPDTRGYSLHVANSLWGHVDYPFLESFTEFVGERFDAPLTLVDFVRDAEGARRRINTWVEERTEEKIIDLIPAGTLTPATTLVLTNAIYFKGNWASQFNVEATREAEFRGLHGTATVPMMNRKGDYTYTENEEAQILEMPYEGEDLSMIVFLPKVEGAVGLEALERALTVESLDTWLTALRVREIRVFVPRFTMTWGTQELRDHLKALGMVRAFESRGADFTGMSEIRDLFVSNVLHKAYIEVDEEGTEAAAATAVVMARTSMSTAFRADRPFVFMLRDKTTGSILFLGRITDLGE